MSNPMMAKLLATQAPMARDLAFEIAVLKRIEQRRYRLGMLANTALGVAAIALLVLTRPRIDLAGNGVTGAALLMTTLCGLTLALQFGLMKRG